MPRGLATEIGICSCDIAHVVQAKDTSRECKCSVVRLASVMVMAGNMSEGRFGIIF